MVIFGAEDQIFDADEAIAAYEEIPGVRTATIEGAGHSPQVETPEKLAPLILEFAADAGDEVLAPAPESAAGGAKGKAKKGARTRRSTARAARRARRRRHQEEAPNADKPANGGGGGGAPKAEKGQKPPSDERPGGD